MWGWCIVTLASARLKASVRFPPLRGMYQRGGTCKGCDKTVEKAKLLVKFVKKRHMPLAVFRKHEAKFSF